MNFEDFDRRLKEADTSLDAMVISQVIMDVMREDSGITFATIEKRLREIGSNTYLLASPIEFRMDGTTCVNPITGEKTEHFLWVCLHGIKESVSTMRDFNIPSAEVNLKWLQSSCGVQILKEPL